MSQDQRLLLCRRVFEFDRESVSILLQTTLDRGGPYAAPTAEGVAASPVLPRVPLGLRFITTTRQYEAVARVMRLLGRSCAVSDLQGTSTGSLRMLVDQVCAAALGLGS